MPGNRNKQLLRLLGLINDLSRSRRGIQIRPLCEKYGVTRRTLERDFQALQDAGYTIESVPDEEPGLVRKRLAEASTPTPPPLTATELAACHAGLGALRQTAAPTVSATFEVVLARLEEAQPAAVAVDAAALAKSQAFVTRPGPTASAKPGIIETIQDAILTCRRLTVTYRKGGTEPPRDYQAEPYGLLFGARNYLVWRGCEDGKFRKFALPYIDAVVAGDEVFAMDEGFDVAAFAERSVGVVLDEEVDVELRVLPEGVERLSTWRFHPQQTVELHKDGSAVVRFSAAGTQELTWALAPWEGLVKVLHPPALEDARR